MKRTWLPAWLAAAVLWFAAAPAPAQTPIVVLSINSVDELLKDAAHCINLAAPDSSKEQALAGLKLADGYLEGIDRSRPAGGLIGKREDDTFQFVAFVPVSSPEAFFATLAKVGMQVEDVEGGFKKAGPIHLKAQKGYVFIGQTTEQLTGLPAPEKVLGTLPENYDLGVSITLKNVPGFFRQLVVGQMQAQLEKQLDNIEDEEAAELQRQLLKQQVKQINQLLNEVEKIDFGMSVDRSAGKMSMELVVDAKNGTNIAKQIAAMRDAKTIFPALVDPSAPISVNLTNIVDDEDQKKEAHAQIKQAESLLLKQIEESEKFDTEEERKFCEDAVGELMDIARELIDGGRIDGAFLLDADDDGKHRLLAAMYVPDAKKLENLGVKALTYLADKAEDDEAPELKKNVAKHKGVDFHRLVPPKDPPEEFEAIFGDDPMILFGFGEETVWFGLGTGVLADLKKAIDGSGEDHAKEARTQAAFSVGKIMKMVAAGNKNEDEAAKILKGAAAAPAGTDRVDVFIEIPQPNRQVLRAEVGEGILKIIKAMSKSDDE